MSEGYAIELYFDPSLENQILKTWNIFARRQISTKLITTESRPHVTLFSTTKTTSFNNSPKLLEPIIKNFISKQEHLSISFSTIGTFSTEQNLLFLTPTPSLSLLQLQSQLCETLKKESVEIGEDFRVDSWVPFCPVGVDVAKTRMSEGFSVLRDLKLPVNGYGVEIGLVEFSPVREVFSFPLGNNSLESC